MIDFKISIYFWNQIFKLSNMLLKSVLTTPRGSVTGMLKRIANNTENFYTRMYLSLNSETNSAYGWHFDMIQYFNICENYLILSLIYPLFRI